MENQKLYPVRAGSKIIKRTLTPKKAVRLRCLDCSGFRYTDVKNCKRSDCVLFTYRLGKGRPSVKLIRKECISCMAGQSLLVRECPDSVCSLYPFRMGHNPNIQLSEEEKQRRAETMIRNRITTYMR